MTAAPRLQVLGAFEEVSYSRPMRTRLFIRNDLPCFPIPNRAACTVEFRAPPRARISSVIVIPYRGESLLLLESSPGVYALPTGALHDGESFDEAIERTLYEQIGAEVSISLYLATIERVHPEESLRSGIASSVGIASDEGAVGVFVAEYSTVYESEEKSEAAPRKVIPLTRVHGELASHCYFELLVAALEAIERDYRSLV